MFELVVAGVPLRVNIWRDGARVLVSFPRGMTEAQAEDVVSTCRRLADGLNVRSVFQAKSGSRRRIIDDD